MIITDNYQNKDEKLLSQKSESTQFINPLKSSLNETVTVENIEIPDHISYARKLIEKNIFSPKRTEDLINRIELIEKRANDPLLYLAVVGEFNSGKSTFINAMLRQRLLKSARVATTASITHIKPGNKFVVTANFVDGITIKAVKNDFRNLAEKLRKVKPDLDSDLFDLNYLLDLMTSEKNIAEKIKSIDIEIPSDHLINNVSIIDTPGINAGAIGAEGHEKITQDVVDNIADAAIILVPSFSPMSNTLINFLDTQARHFLHRCIFVVTAMDKQDEIERHNIINFVKLKLEEKLNLSNPTVIQSSAITMIPVKTIPPSMQNSWEYWQKQFEELELLLKQTMIKQRGVIISESLIRLLKELIKELDEDLNKKKKELTKEQLLLKESSVGTIENVLNVLYDESAEKITREISSLESYASSKKRSFCSDAKTEVNSIIKDSEWDTQNYETKVTPKIKESVKKHGKSYLKKVKNETYYSLDETCSNICKDFARQFKENYKNFPFLGAEIEVPSLSISSISVPKLDFSSSESYMESQSDEDSKGAIKGALGGAAVGIPFGIPGMVIGFVLGGFGGHACAGDSLEERKRKICSFINNNIDDYFKKYNKQIKRNLEDICEDILSQLKDAVDAHIKEYSYKVKELMAIHEKEESRLKEQIKQINLDILELSRRNQKLDSLKKRLLTR